VQPEQVELAPAAEVDPVVLRVQQQRPATRLLQPPPADCMAVVPDQHTMQVRILVVMLLAAMALLELFGQDLLFRLEAFLAIIPLISMTAILLAQSCQAMFYYHRHIPLRVPAPMPQWLVALLKH
jgi:hypothetical protein